MILYNVFGIDKKITFVTPLYLSEETAWKKKSTKKIRDVEAFVEFR